VKLRQVLRSQTIKRSWEGLRPFSRPQLLGPTMLRLVSQCGPTLVAMWYAVVIDLLILGASS
jgi:hypothetical protein